MKLSLIFIALSLSLAIGQADKSDLNGWKGFLLTNGRNDPRLDELILACQAFVIEEDGQGIVKQVAVAPKYENQFVEGLKELSIRYKIMSEDVGGDIDVEKYDNGNAAFVADLAASGYAEGSAVRDVTTYFAKTSEILSWLQSVADQSNGLCRIQDIGQSFERRTLRLLKCSTNGGTSKKIVFLDSAIHAREWMAPATLLFIIKKLVNGYKAGDAGARAILDKYDFEFFPVINPDGYDYTFSSQRARFWRKTRQPYGRAFGADPNRNWDSHFCGPGTSRYPSSDVYCGPRPFSEPETKAMSVYLSGVKNRLKMYLSFHTYGQFWLTPPGYTRRLPADHQEMMRVANIGARALSAVNGNNWRVGQPANIGLYEAAGGSYDWVKQKLGVKYSYTFECRPRWPAGMNGFLAYPYQIPDSGNEVYAAVLAAANALP